MFGRAFWFMLLLGAAVGIPYVATEWSKLKASVTGQGATADSAAKTAAGGKSLPGGSGSSVPATDFGPAGPNPRSEETPLVEMSEAFRFNAAPSWIMARWPRVSAGIPSENMNGLRVPLITGMRPDDVAGALTYYFTPSQRCAKITFSGTTGDPRRLKALMTQRFGFKPYTSDPGVERYEIRWNGKAHSELLIRTAAIVRSSSPHARYEVQAIIAEPAAR